MDNNRNSTVDSIFEANRIIQSKYRVVKNQPSEQHSSNYNGSKNNTPHITPQPVAASANKSGTNGWGIASMVTGIVGMFCCLPCAIAAVVTGVIALTKGRKDGFTITGLITGGLGLFIDLIYIIVSFLR